jgi:hypothetical protein
MPAEWLTVSSHLHSTTVAAGIELFTWQVLVGRVSSAGRNSLIHEEGK